MDLAPGSPCLKSKRRKLAEKVFSYVPWTPIANITGQPSMSVPPHWTDAGLPVSVMLTAPIGREDMLFRLASQLESAQPWWSRSPKDPF
jgi:amidase